jgi:fructose-bisphosphate aldolase class 1
MNSQLLGDTAKLLFGDHKGLLAMDESTGTCNKRFEKLGIPQTVEARSAYREPIVTTPGLGESIGGAILYDETIRQQKSDGTPYAKALIAAGITPGIRVDTGAKDLAGHPMEQCCEVTGEVLRTVFSELFAQRVVLEGMVLKPNMVLPGISCGSQPTLDKAADATVNCFLRSVPAAAPAIAFLSGGQPAELATARLNAMNARFKSRLPWALAFSFARAIQQPALEIWNGQQANVVAAQRALYHRARCNQAARSGEYSPAMETDGHMLQNAGLRAQESEVSA